MKKQAAVLLAPVLATSPIRSQKSAHGGSPGSFSLLSLHQRDDMRVSHMKFTLSSENG